MAVAANVPPITAATALSVTDQGAWTPFSGQWVYENGKLVQTMAQGFDHGISRAGSVGDFEMSVRLRHRQGVGGGVLFHLPTATSQNGGHMVRFFEDNSLAWGYFSSAGVFTGQGFAAIAPPGSEPQLLKVIAISNTYSITLNGTILAENIPLISKEGLLGLTSSTSVVEFDAGVPERADVSRAVAGAARPLRGGRRLPQSVLGAGGGRRHPTDSLAHVSASHCRSWRSKSSPSDTRLSSCASSAGSRPAMSSTIIL